MISFWVRTIFGGFLFAGLLSASLSIAILSTFW